MLTAADQKHTRYSDGDGTREQREERAPELRERARERSPCSALFHCACNNYFNSQAVAELFAAISQSETRFANF